MVKGLETKVALLAGGGEGVGRSIALALSARGVRVVVTGRNERALGETVGEIAYGGGKARHLAGDLEDPAHVEAAAGRAIEVFGSLDIVIASTDEHGPADLARVVLDTVASRVTSGGRLLVTSSVLGGAPDGQAALSSRKQALSRLVGAKALEVASRKVTCNAIVAATVETDAAERRVAELAAARGKTKDETRAEIAALSPFGRFLQPEEVAELVLFLCASSGDAVTGQTIVMGTTALE